MIHLLDMIPDGSANLNAHLVITRCSLEPLSNIPRSFTIFGGIAAPKTYR